MQLRRWLVAFAVLTGLAGCGRAPLPEPAPLEMAATPVLRPVPLIRLPMLIDDGDDASLARAARLSLGYLRRQDPDREVEVLGRRYRIADYVRALEDFVGWLDAGISRDRLAAEVVHRFAVYETAPADGQVLVTGYYEPVIDASLERRPGYDVPLWGPPSGVFRVDLGDFAEDLAGRRIAGRLEGGRLVPLPDRAGMRRGGLAGARVLAWARDAVDAFFLEIQGSGSLRLPGGQLLRVGYAAQNGRPYRSIGKLLIDEARVPRERMSMQAIRSYLAQHPEEMERILDHNPSVVYFRKLEGEPLGSLGLPVVPQRAVATDHQVVPKGVLCFLDTELPGLAADGTTVAEGRLARFVFNHDTGGAIRGPGRVDFFWGRGDDAAYRAGIMKQPGRLLIFVPRESLPIEADDGDAAVPSRSRTGSRPPPGH